MFALWCSPSAIVQQRPASRRSGDNSAQPWPAPAVSRPLLFRWALSSCTPLVTALAVPAPLLRPAVSRGIQPARSVRPRAARGQGPRLSGAVLRAQRAKAAPLPATPGASGPRLGGRCSPARGKPTPASQLAAVLPRFAWPRPVCFANEPARKPGNLQKNPGNATLRAVRALGCRPGRAGFHSAFASSC